MLSLALAARTFVCAAALAGELSHDKFAEPPNEARPGAYWCWINGNVNKERITYELEQMKEKGMSGAEIWDVGVYRRSNLMSVPAGPRFLGPESLDAIHHAIDEATRLDLDLGIIASSSWNCGGTWVKPEHAMKQLVVGSVVVKGGQRITQRLPFPKNRAPKGADGRPVYYRRVAVLAFPVAQKSASAGVDAVLNLTDKVDAGGVLTWNAPAGKWLVQRFVCTNTGQRMMVPSPRSNGLIIDHLDGEAAEFHFEYITKMILAGRKKLDALRYMESDSIEVHRSLDWTGRFIEAFKRLRGYDPTPYLPILAGMKFADPEVNRRFRFDYDNTVSDLWIEGHYEASTRILSKYGLDLVAEAGHGGYPRVESLRAMGACSIPRTEFWNGSRFWLVKEGASAAHIYGRTIADAEAFTGWRHWQDGPLEYKRLADVAFCAGLNRITFHTFAHNPSKEVLPGVIYHAGEHFNVHTTWWHQSRPMLMYFSRCCYMLQQGLPVADVCYYYGHKVPSLVPTRRIGPSAKRRDGEAKCAHCGAPNPSPVSGLGPGYDYDMVNGDVIINRMRVENGGLVLPDGVRYRMMVLPPTPDMPLPVLEKIERLVRGGATILGPAPRKTPSLIGYPDCDRQVASLVEKLWGECDGRTVPSRAYGKGRVVWDRAAVRTELESRKIVPDFTSSISGLDYIHRRTKRADIYFVSNTEMKRAVGECFFRVTGKLAYFWYPDSGKVRECSDYRKERMGTSVTVDLPPAGSVFVVFSDKPFAFAEKPRGGIRGIQTARDAATMVLPPNGRMVDGPWLVRFQEDRGAPDEMTFDRLVPWTTIPNDGVKHFSGTATYIKDLDIPAGAYASGSRVMLDLGNVRHVAEVFVNGRNCGIAWKPPYSVDITDAIRNGTNRLGIKVTNTWANRIVGDSKAGGKRLTRYCQSVPVKGPHSSGLLGPVTLVTK